MSSLGSLKTIEARGRMIPILKESKKPLNTVNKSAKKKLFLSLLLSSL